MILVFETFRIVYSKIYRKIKYPHHFYFEKDKLYSEHYDWAADNTKEKWIAWKEYKDYFELDDGYMFGFSNKEDAMAFKLRWC